MTEAQALAIWCAALRDLRARAQVNDWTDRLEREAARVAAGGSARRACEKFGLVALPSHRGSGDTLKDVLRLPGQERQPPSGRGTFGCPHGRCDRRAERDDMGRVPVCEVAGPTLMRPLGRDQ